MPLGSTSQLFQLIALVAVGGVAVPAHAGLVAVASEFMVNTYTRGDQDGYGVDAAADGDFTIVWDSRGAQDGSGRGVFGQRFDSAGQKLGTEFQANTYTFSDQDIPRVGVARTAKSFVVVWRDSIQDGYPNGIFGQRFASGGQRAGTEFQINTHTTLDEIFPDVAAQPSGDFMVV